MHVTGNGIKHYFTICHYFCLVRSFANTLAGCLCLVMLNKNVDSFQKLFLNNPALSQNMIILCCFYSILDLSPHSPSVNSLLTHNTHLHNILSSQYLNSSVSATSHCNSAQHPSYLYISEQFLIFFRSPFFPFTSYWHRLYTDFSWLHAK